MALAGGYLKDRLPFSNWSVKGVNLPPFIPRPRLLKRGQQLTTVLLTTYKSWDPPSRISWDLNISWSFGGLVVKKGLSLKEVSLGKTRGKSLGRQLKMPGCLKPWGLQLVNCYVSCTRNFVMPQKEGPRISIKCVAPK